jgi:hypothetical protein
MKQNEKPIGNDRWYYICFKCGEKVANSSRFWHELNHKELKLKKDIQRKVE